MSAEQPEPQVPDPNGPPVLPSSSLKHESTFFKASVNWTLVGAVSGVAAFIILGTAAMPTSGARRSYRVQWQQRQQEIAQAHADSEAHQDSLAADQTHD